MSSRRLFTERFCSPSPLPSSPPHFPPALPSFLHHLYTKACIPRPPTLPCLCVVRAQNCVLRWRLYIQRRHEKLEACEHYVALVALQRRSRLVQVRCVCGPCYARAAYIVQIMTKGHACDPEVCCIATLGVWHKDPWAVLVNH